MFTEGGETTKANWFRANVQWTPNSALTPAYVVKDRNNETARLHIFTDDEYRDQPVSLRESLAFSSAALGTVAPYVYPHLAPLHPQNRARMVDGAFWDRCGVAGALAQLQAAPDVKLVFIGTDTEAMKDYSRDKVSDATMKPIRLFDNLTESIEDGRLVLTGTTRAVETFRPNQRVAIHCVIRTPPGNLDMLFEARDHETWNEFASGLLRTPHSAEDECFDAVCIQGGGMIALVNGACTLWRFKILPRVISGVSGGAWATSVYFEHMHGRSGDEAESSMLSFLVDSQKRYEIPERGCEPTSELLTFISNSLQRLGYDISKLIQKSEFHWKNFVDTLVGKTGKWSDTKGFTVVHPCCVLQDASLTREEVRLWNEQERTRRSQWIP